MPICISALNCNFVVWNQCCDLQNGITSHTFNIVIWKRDQSSSVPCNPSPANNLLLTTHIQSQWISGHNPSADGIHRVSFISGRNPSPSAPHLQQQFFSSCDSSPAGIHLQLYTNSGRDLCGFEQFVSTWCKMALVWAAFRDCSCRCVSPLPVLFNNLHNVHLQCKNGSHWLIIASSIRPYGMGCFKSKSKFMMQPCSTSSYSMQLQEYTSTPFNSTPLTCNPPIWQSVAGLKVDWTVSWQMQQECLCLGFSEYLHQIAIYCWDNDDSSIIWRHHVCRCAGSICKL